jgi:threonine synthase
MHLKFAGFQDLYFENRLPAEYDITTDRQLVNAPRYVHPEDLEQVPAPGKPLAGEALDRFVKKITEAIAQDLGLREPRHP